MAITGSPRAMCTRAATTQVLSSRGPYLAASVARGSASSGIFNSSSISACARRRGTERGAAFRASTSRLAAALRSPRIFRSFAALAATSGRNVMRGRKKRAPWLSFDRWMKCWVTRVWSIVMAPCRDTKPEFSAPRTSAPLSRSRSAAFRKSSSFDADTPSPSQWRLGTIDGGMAIERRQEDTYAPSSMSSVTRSCCIRLPSTAQTETIGFASISMVTRRSMPEKAL
mmetsp:Transcript_14345/g.28236  ORF Transcript_14345/g.28236 Transcript_14345/m.28236 type:complete len:227 (-) Transcript_14345:374-1054(-)